MLSLYRSDDQSQCLNGAISSCKGRLVHQSNTLDTYICTDTCCFPRFPFVPLTLTTKLYSQYCFCWIKAFEIMLNISRRLRRPNWLSSDTIYWWNKWMVTVNVSILRCGIFYILPYNSKLWVNICRAQLVYVYIFPWGIAKLVYDLQWLELF